MTARVSRFAQVLIAVVVTACVLFLEIVMFGPTIDGRIPSLAETIQIVAVEAVIVGAFVLSAIALFRWHKFGWWLSVLLDGLLGLGAASAVLADFRVRYTATQAAREAFRGDLVIHGTILLVCIGATVLLLLSRKRFLAPAPLKRN